MVPWHSSVESHKVERSGTVIRAAIVKIGDADHGDHWLFCLLDCFEDRTSRKALLPWRQTNLALLKRSTCRDGCQCSTR